MEGIGALLEENGEQHNKEQKNLPDRSGLKLWRSLSKVRLKDNI